MITSGAKAEVINRINSICGFTISEEKLPPSIRMAITSLANTLKELELTRQVIIIEEKEYMKKGRTLFRNKKDLEELEKNLITYKEKLNILINKFNERLKELSQEIINDLTKKDYGNKLDEKNYAMESKLIIEPIHCKKCGAQLKLSTTGITKCEYCGTIYKISEYLDLLSDIIENDKKHKIL